MFYEKSSRIVSSKLITRRFSNRDGLASGGMMEGASGNMNSHGMHSGHMIGGNSGGGLVR